MSIIAGLSFLAAGLALFGLWCPADWRMLLLPVGPIASILFHII